MSKVVCIVTFKECLEVLGKGAVRDIKFLDHI
jgi:hypothetical protein